MTRIDQLLALVDAYRDAKKVSDARVATLVFNDGDKIANLRGGRDIGVRRLDRAIQWFSDNWPDGAAWPVGIDRPRPTQRARAEAAE